MASKKKSSGNRPINSAANRPAQSGPVTRVGNETTKSSSVNTIQRPTTTSTTIKDRRNAPPPSNNNTFMFVVVGLVLLAVAVVVSLLVLGGGKSNPTTQPAANATAGSNAAPAGSADVPVGADAAAQVETFPSQGQYHLQPGETALKILGQPYNSNPPTSGPHQPYATHWGIYQQPVPDDVQVHNLEHGGVIIQYDCPQGCTNTINSLSSYALRYPADSFTGIILAPRTGMPNGARIALTAWTHRLLLTSLDQAKINQFIAAYLNQAPEKDPSFHP